MLGYYLVTFLHVVVCIILILVVLLQSGKGADLAGAFGGGATQTAFGSRGPSSFLSKLTTGAAILFMVTCLSLSILKNNGAETSVLEDSESPVTAPVQQEPIVQPEAPTPTPEEIKRMQEEAESNQMPSGAQSPDSAGDTTVPAEKESPQGTKRP